MSIANRLKATWSGDGSHVVVLSHGFGLDQTSWADLRPALDVQFRVLSYNLAGCGDEGASSYHHDVHNSLFGYADDLLTLLDEAQVQSLLPRAIDTLGGPFTVLVNNASVFEYDNLHRSTSEIRTHNHKHALMEEMK